MKAIIIAQIIVAISLIISILLQNRGSGLSAAFGGSFGGYHTKRGMEKFLFYGSVILAVAFVVLAVVSVKVTAN